MSRRTRRRNALALQGSGAHDARTWDVLDRLLEDARREIEAVSATSAGAMNAAVLAHGLMIDGAACRDDGDVGHPSLLPLTVARPAPHLIPTPINPRRCEQVPTMPQQVLNPFNQITFNGSPGKNLRTVALRKQLPNSECRTRRDGAPSLPGQIDAWIDAASDLHAALPFVMQPRRVGRVAAHRWPAHNGGHLGRRSTIDLKPRLGPVT